MVKLVFQKLELKKNSFCLLQALQVPQIKTGPYVWMLVRATHAINLAITAGYLYPATMNQPIVAAHHQLAI